MGDVRKLVERLIIDKNTELLAECIENSTTTFEERRQRSKRTHGRFADLMMQRHNVSYETAIDMITCCCGLKMPYIGRLFRKELSREYWREINSAIDTYVITRFTKPKELLVYSEQ